MECSIGFYGFNCSRKCRYPNYGERCQLSCACNETLCDAAFGCENQGILAENKTDSSGLNLSIIIPSVCLGATVIIFSVIFLIHKKKMYIENNGESNTAATPSGGTERVIADTSILYNPNPLFSNEHYGYEDFFPRQSKNSRYEYDFLIPGHCFQTG
uniref:Uncharacterized protein LOC111101911 n=1 Tax=Crassostrea virginica TaxID=6565 RepID=A0A8B8AJS1_CRAVI|nr:uncharacterized protein LOC111101911 [Crassostrea virginica]